MKRIVSIVAAAVTLLPAAAQEKWTLRQCIDHAVENNIELRQTALTVENAELELNTSRNSRLPNLNGRASQYFNFGRTSIDTGGANPSYINTQSATTSFSVSTELPVFQGFRIGNQIKADRLELGAAAQNLERARQSLELNVAGLYLEVLFKKEILAVYREQSALTRKQVENTAEMVEQGKVARAQLYDINAQLAQNEVNEVGAENDLALALLNLSQALNLEYAPDFDIAEPEIAELTSYDFAGIQSPDAVYETALGIKPQVREAELRLENSRYRVKIAKSYYWPQISFGASVGDGYNYVFGQDYTQQTFIDQIRNRHSESVGLNMSIPVFNRNATRNGVRAARLGVTNSSLELEGVRLALYKEIQQAHQGAVAARARYDATLKALTAAEESFRAMELRYNNGKATVYEYSEANTGFISSMSEQAQAKYNYLFCTKILDFYNGKQIDI